MLAAADRPVRADDDKPKQIATYCPAIGVEDRPRTNALGVHSRQPTLVVLGTVRRTGKADKYGTHQTVEIDVEKVLFGSPAVTKVRCVAGFGYWPDEKPQRLILALSPVLDSKEYSLEVRYTLPPEEEKAVATLSAARMAYNVLSAETIFVGKEILASADKGRVIEVLRVLHGPESLKGKKVCVDLLEHPLRSNFTVPAEPLTTPGEHLYFVASVDPEYKRKRYYRSNENPDGPVYLVPYLLPADLEKVVVESLKQRDRYPLVELGDEGDKVTHREILFQGSIEAAVTLVGSESKGAVLLAGRFLIHRKKDALAPVLAAIKADLLLGERKGGFHQLNTLISLLPQLDAGTKREAAHELIEMWLAHLAKKPPEPPAVERRPHDTYYRSEQGNVDVNHSLAWLVAGLDERTVLEQYGKRLLALRGQMPGRWKQEIQLALNVARVEDNFEMVEATDRLKGVQPVRSKSAMRHPGGSGEGVVAFTPDGKHLATVGGGDIRVWRTSDWALAAPAIPLQGSIAHLVFSPDGKYLYVAGGGGGLQRHDRYSWKEGRLDRAYVGHKSGVADLLLSADGKTMVTSNYYEDAIHVWETESGKIRKTFKTPYLGHQIALSPDGETLMRRIALGEDAKDDAKTAWSVEALGPGALKIPKAVLADNPQLVAFSPDGKQFLTIGRTGAYSPGPLERSVRLYDVQNGFREVGKSTFKSLPTHRVTFDVERRVVLIEGHWSSHDVHALTLPDLKPVKGFEKAQERCRDPKSACFSPDGKLLAVGSMFRPVPQLFRTDTYEELIPYDGHPDKVSQVFFPPGGKLLRTLGADNSICTWNTQTMKMVKRQHLPLHWNVVSSREPDGRYLIGWAKAEEKEDVFQTYDVEADKVIATVRVRREMFSRLEIFWINDHEVYMVTAGELCHFDAITGKVIARREFKTELGRWSKLTEDGKDFLTIGGAIPRSSSVEVQRVNVATGQSTLVGKCGLSAFSGNNAGVLPGAKFFYVSDPGIYLFDSRTLKPVASLDCDSILSLSFTSDGSRFAAVTGSRIYVDRNLQQWDSQTQSVVRIHDAQTGRTLGAFPTSTRWVTVKLSHDGKQLAVTNDDGTIELWDLSALNCKGFSPGNAPRMLAGR